MNGNNSLFIYLYIYEFKSELAPIPRPISRLAHEEKVDQTVWDDLISQIEFVRTPEKRPEWMFKELQIYIYNA